MIKGEDSDIILNIDGEEAKKYRKSQRLRYGLKPDDAIPERTSSIWSRAMFDWLSPLIRLGTERPLERDDMWRVHEYDSSFRRTNMFEKELADQRKRRGDNYCVLWALLYTRLPEFALCTLMKALGETADIVAPTLVGELIGYIEDSSQKDDSYPWIIGGIFVSMYIFRTFIMNQYVNLTIQIGIARRTACMGAVFNKAMNVRMSTSTDEDSTPRNPNKKKKKHSSVGEVTNLMSNDCERIRMASALFQNLWFQPLFIITSLVLIFNVLGISGLIGFAIMVLFVPVQMKVTQWMISLRRKTLAVSDKRTDEVHAAVTGVRALKVLAWEKPLIEKIESTRRDELKILRSTLMLQALVRVSHRMLYRLFVPASLILVFRLFSS